MIVRELITLLGFTVDQASFKKAEKAVEDLHGALVNQGEHAKQASKDFEKVGASASAMGGSIGQVLSMLGRQIAGLGIGATLHQFVQMASDANETSSAIKQLFGVEGAAEVDKWSHDMGEAMGRSAYDLQQYVARLGSVLGPVTKTREEAQLMAESLAGLSVDLASFFNTSDQEAMMALRSGLTGEYESLKRFGIVINEATLQEIAHARGIKKKTTAMTVAEKTELRYAAVMERSKQAQGDAARTGEGFANASKALQAQIKTLGIDMARTFLPAIEKVVRVARETIKWFNELREGTKVLEAAFLVLASAAALLARETLMAFLLPAVALAALILLVDELWNLFTGGQSIIGDWLDETFGIGTTNFLVEQLIGLVEDTATAFGKAAIATKEWLDYLGDLEGTVEILERWTGAGEDFGVWLAGIGDKVHDWLVKPFTDAYNVYVRWMHAMGRGKNLTEAEPLVYQRAQEQGLTSDVMGSSLGEVRGQRRRERESARRTGILTRRQERQDEEERYLQAQYAAGLDAAAGGEAPMTPGTAWGSRRRRRRAEARKALESPAWSESPEAAAARVAALTEQPGGMSSLPAEYDVAATDQSISPYAAAAEEAAASEPSASTMPSNMSVAVSMPSPVINISGDPTVVRRTVEQVLAEQRKRGIAAIPTRGGM